MAGDAEINVKMVLVVRVKVNLDRWREDHGLNTTLEAQVDAMTSLPQAFAEEMKVLTQGKSLAYSVTDCSTHGLPSQLY